MGPVRPRQDKKTATLSGKTLELFSLYQDVVKIMVVEEASRVRHDLGDLVMVSNEADKLALLSEASLSPLKNVDEASDYLKILETTRSMKKTGALLDHLLDSVAFAVRLLCTYMADLVKKGTENHTEQNTDNKAETCILLVDELAAVEDICRDPARAQAWKADIASVTAFVGVLAKLLVNPQALHVKVASTADGGQELHECATALTRYKKALKTVDGTEYIHVKDVLSAGEALVTDASTIITKAVGPRVAGALKRMNDATQALEKISGGGPIDTTTGMAEPWSRRWKGTPDTAPQEGRLPGLLQEDLARGRREQDRQADQHSCGGPRVPSVRV